MVTYDDIYPEDRYWQFFETLEEAQDYVNKVSYANTIAGYTIYEVKEMPKTKIKNVCL